MLGTFIRRCTIGNIRLYKPHLETFFEGNQDQALKEVNVLKKKYSLDDRSARRLFRINPQVFLNGSPQRTQIEDKIKFLNELEQTEPIAKVINQILFQGRHLVKAMKKEDIVNFIATIKDLGFDEKSAGSFFGSSPSFVHHKFHKIYNEKLEIMQDYLQLTPQESLEIFIAQPFLLRCSARSLRSSIVYLLGTRNSVLTKQAIIDLMKRLGEFFLMGEEQMKILIARFSSWSLSSREELWKTLLEHPLLLLNHPNQILYLKAKMFRQFRFTKEMSHKMLSEHPSALICSVRSLESKLLTARDRLRITLTAANVQYLSFKYMSNIRPRAEMMIRARVPYTSEDIVDYLKCSDEEFVEKTKIPAAKLREEKMKFSITPELDFLQKKCLKGYPSDRKIYDYSKRYYSSEDLILKKQ